MNPPPESALASPPPSPAASPPGAPPHNLEAEMSVLGAILISDRTLYALVIEEGLKPEDFYRERHRLIYDAMLRLYREGEPIDVLTVTEQLKQLGQLDDVGGESSVDALAGAVPSVANARRYAQIVRENALMRRLLTATYEIQTEVGEHRYAPRDLVERAEKMMLEVAHDDRQADFRRIEEVLYEELEKMQRLSAEGTSLTGTPSGFKDLDEITGGFQPGNLIIVAARPSMGKCLGPDALVHDPMTGARRRMEDVVESVERGHEVWVTAVGPDLRLEPALVSAAFRNGVRPVLRVTTRLGRTLDATANHPLLTLDGWKRIDELRPGARVAVPRSLPTRGRPGYLLDAELVLLAGLIADGCLVNATPRFTAAGDSPVLTEVRAAAEDLGARVHLGWRGSNVEAGISGPMGARGRNPVTMLCRRHGLMGKRSEDKFVPDAIFGLDQRKIARFLGVLFGCDGYIHATGRLRHIGYTTISERLARDVQHLLLRLGVVSTIRTLKRKVYEGTGKVAREVRITDQASLGAFCELVHVVGKRDAQERVLAELGLLGRKTNTDTVPLEIWSQLLAAKGPRSWADVSQASGHPRNHNWHVGMRGVSRPQLEKLATALEDEPLEHLATSDLWWDEIASIEPAGEVETFDLTVPEHHNFVADDVIVHNSALVTNIAENAAIDHERSVALFSLEMSETELAQRFVASQGRIFGDKLRKGRVPESEWPRILEASQRLARAPLFIDDSSDIGILDIRAKARRLHATAPGGLGLIIVDYLQLMRPEAGSDNRVEQVGAMSRGLKILARELGVPVIALSQLSRAVEQRHDKKPILSDLRECVTGDTLVVLADGRRLPIRDLIGQQPEVIAVDERDRLVKAQSDKVWPVGEREVFAVRLASGRSLHATADHRIRCGGGWRRVSEIGIGDRVALARRLPAPAEAERWPDERVVLLGHLIGDGSYLTGQPLRYTTASEENSAAVAGAAEREFGCRVTRHAGRGSWHQLVIAGNGTRWAPAGVNAWLRELGIWNQRSRDKRVPDAAFRLADDQLGLLLRHLWATDGTLWTGRSGRGRFISRIAFATASAALASDVAALLLRLGIVARTTVTRERTGGRTHHVVVSGASDQRRFLDVVGAFGPRKTHVAALAASLSEVSARTNVDTLPRETWRTVRSAMATGSVTQRQMAAMRGTAYGGTAHFKFAPSRNVVASYAELLGDETLADAAASDLFWDRVVAIEPAGVEEVYDLTVPGPACWLADGIVSHNSGQIEQDADLVMFIYRDEYYNKEESEDQGLAEILIAKHRNGGLGDVTLTFRKEYPKFLNFAGERFER